MAELDTVLAVLARRKAGLVNVGHGRDEDSRRRATEVLEACGGGVGVVLPWPAAAASWRRPAQRLAAGAPDLWVVADTAAGWTGFSARLAETSWEPARTVAFAGLADPSLPHTAGRAATEGMC